MYARYISTYVAHLRVSVVMNSQFTSIAILVVGHTRRQTVDNIKMHASRPPCFTGGVERTYNYLIKFDRIRPTHVMLVR